MDLPRLRRGGVGLQVFACFIPNLNHLRNHHLSARGYAPVGRTSFPMKRMQPLARSIPQERAFPDGHEPPETRSTRDLVIAVAIISGKSTNDLCSTFEMCSWSFGSVDSNMPEKSAGAAPTPGSPNARSMPNGSERRLRLARPSQPGKIGVPPAIENGHAIAADLRKLEPNPAAAGSYITLTHSRHLEWSKAASSGEAFSGDHGLTSCGEEVRPRDGSDWGCLDVSHVHERTFWDVVRLAKKPFIASHSNAPPSPLKETRHEDQCQQPGGVRREFRREVSDPHCHSLSTHGVILDPGRYFKEVKGNRPGSLFADLER